MHSPKSNILYSLKRLPGQKIRRIPENIDFWIIHFPNFVSRFHILIRNKNFICEIEFFILFSAFFPFQTASIRRCIVEIDVFFKIFSAKNLKVQINISRLLSEMPFWAFHILSSSIQSYLLVCFLSYIINFLSVCIQFCRSVDWYHTFWISQT